MIKRILVPLDPSAFAEQALNLACRIAKVHDAEVTGLVILDVPGISSSIGPIPPGASYYARQLQESKIKEAKTRIKELLANFHNICEKFSVKAREHETQGMPSIKIITESMFYDLLVIGMRTHFHFETQEGPGDSFDDIIEQSITPIIAVPDKLKIPDEGKPINALLALDGTNPSTRAMKRFIHLIQPFHDIVNIQILTSHEDKQIAQHFLEKAEDYIKAHLDIEVSTRISTKNIIKLMEDEYLEWSHGIVLGVHLSKGVFEFMTGSLTRYLTRECKVPMFIAQ